MFTAHSTGYADVSKLGDRLVVPSGLLQDQVVETRVQFAEMLELASCSTTMDKMEAQPFDMGFVQAG